MLAAIALSHVRGVHSCARVALVSELLSGLCDRVDPQRIARRCLLDRLGPLRRRRRRQFRSSHASDSRAITVPFIFANAGHNVTVAGVARSGAAHELEGQLQQRRRLQEQQ